MSTIKVSYLVYAEGTDSEGNMFYFEKDKIRDVDIQPAEFNEIELDSSLSDDITKEIHLYENKRISYAFNKSNYKKNNIYGSMDDNPGVTVPIGKVKTTKIIITDIEII
ncbi:hypothetical protein [Romboutsia sp.]|uniref:hypothetical protein n=1 Tax=Romboutsia sp. TaxID=1965302 RepID=UPI003F3113DF